MKVIIAGSRTIGYDVEIVAKAVLDSGFNITEVVSGTARGIDRAGEEWARLRGIPIRRFPADWETFGKRAGYLRNRQMAAYADALIAIWDGESKGTCHMIALATDFELSVFVMEVVGNE